VQDVIEYEGEELIVTTANAAGGNSGGGAFLIRNGKLAFIGILSRASDEGDISLVAPVHAD
jgi:hypothetical protein